MNISASLKAIRITKNLTQRQVSDTLNIPIRTYQSYENGLRELSLENALKLAKFYKISVEQLCTYAE